MFSAHGSQDIVADDGGLVKRNGLICNDLVYPSISVSLEASLGITSFLLELGSFLF
jgi:hypothetical protein